MLAQDFAARVHSVDWNRYRQGMAALDIGEHLVGLIMPSLELRRDHRACLERQLLPRDVVAEACYYALPFILELLRAGESPALIYDLLHVMASTCDPEAYDEGFVLGHSARSLTAACRAQMTLGLPVYLRDLADAALPRHVRRDALLLVGRFDDWRDTSRRNVESVHTREADPELRDDLAAWLWPPRLSDAAASRAEVPAPRRG